MSERHIAIDYTQYNGTVNEITISGQACLLNNSILCFLEDISKTTSGVKLAAYLNDLCKSSNMHNKHVSDNLTTFLMNLRSEYEKLDKASSDTLKLE